MKFKVAFLFTLLAGVSEQCAVIPRQAASPYDVLEIPPGSSLQEARRAYRRLAKQYHPDRSTLSKEEANAKFIQLREAYETIADPKGLPETYFRESTSFNQEQAPDSSARDAGVNPNDVDYAFLMSALNFPLSSLPLFWSVASSSNKGDIFFNHAKKDKQLIQKMLQVFPGEVQQVIILNAIKQHLLSYDELPDALKAEPGIKAACQSSFINRVLEYFSVSANHENNISEMAKAYLATDKIHSVLGCIKPTPAILKELFECFPKKTQYKIAIDLIWQRKIPFVDLPQIIKENTRLSEMNQSRLLLIALEHPLASSILIGWLAACLCPSGQDESFRFFSSTQQISVQLYTSSMSFMLNRLYDGVLSNDEKLINSAKTVNTKLAVPAPLRKSVADAPSNQALGAQTKVTMSDNLRTKKTKWVKKLEQYSSCLFERNKIKFGKTNEINPELKEHGSQKHRCTIS